MDSSVGIAADYELDDWGSIPGVHTGFGAHLTLVIIILSWQVKLSSNLYLVPRAITIELYLHSPIRLHGGAVN
jgi:hypothetical protein